MSAARSVLALSVLAATSLAGCASEEAPPGRPASLQREAPRLGEGRISPVEGPSAEIVVRVNGSPITRADLDDALRMEDWGIDSVPDSAAAGALRREARERVLQSLIDEALFLAAAREAGVTLSAEEDRGVRKAFEDAVIERWGSLDALQEELGRRGIRLERLQSRFRAGLVIRKLALEETGPAPASRPEEELRRYYEARDAVAQEVEDLARRDRLDALRERLRRSAVVERPK